MGVARGEARRGDQARAAGKTDRSARRAVICNEKGYFRFFQFILAVVRAIWGALPAKGEQGRWEGWGWRGGGGDRG